MATIRQKGPEQWHAQIRRTGWPPVSKTLRTLKDAEMWARGVESNMDRGIFVDPSAAERTTFGETIKSYIKEVTEKRPGEASRAAEKSRLERFMRDEPKLCAFAVAHLRPEHFEEYRDRRLTQLPVIGKTTSIFGFLRSNKAVRVSVARRERGTSRLSPFFVSGRCTIRLVS